MKEHRFYIRRRGIKCKIENCNDWCVCDNLCHEHNIQLRQDTQEYQDYLNEYNKYRLKLRGQGDGKYKFPLTCKECGGEFKGRTTFIQCCSSKCRARKFRRTDKGKACIVRHNTKVKRPDIKKVCPNCGKLYITARKTQRWCSTCSKSVGAYEAQKRYRTKNIGKVRARDNLGRRTRRRFTPETCCINNCNIEGEAHHPDYERPYEIVWLCRTHHRNVHTGKIKFLDKDIRCDVQWERVCLMNAELFKHEARIITEGSC